MREEYGKYKIAIYWNKKEINIARSMLDNLNLTGIEPTDRLIIQKYIDLNDLKATILYDGNGVWSYKKVIRDFKRALNSKSCKKNEYGSGEYDLTNYLYDFLHLCCGSIAHYNKYGWIGTYPTKNELKLFMRENEFGHDIVREQPDWKTDCIRIAKELLRIVNM